MIVLKQDKERLEYYYANDNDENLRGHRDNQGILEFITTQEYMKKIIPPHSTILDACAGCGVYSFFLAELGHTVTAGDYVEHNVKMIRNRQKDNPLLHTVYCGSAADLSRFDDESFDVVLNMGAYYHITDKDEREKTISESLRVLKKDKLLFLSYLNKFSNIVKHQYHWLEDYEVFEKLLERGHCDEDSLFYQSTPEEIEELAKKYSLQILHNIATDGFKATVTDTINTMDEIQFARYVRYHLGICETKSILGYSEHALAILRKSLPVAL